MRYCDLGLDDHPKLNVADHLERIQREITRDQRPWLVVLDDVWQTEPILPFLTVSDQISLLMTTRQRDVVLDLGEHLASDALISVEALEAEAAATILRETAGLPRDGFDQEIDLLVQLVGGLPLLLMVMGRYLRTQGTDHPAWVQQTFRELREANLRLNLPALSIDAAQAQLKSPGWVSRLLQRKPKPLTSKVIIALSYDALPSPAQRTFLSLAAFPPAPLSFDEYTARMISEVPAHAFEEALRVLCQRSLLDSPEPGRFQLHQVLRDWAEAQDDHQVREARRQLRRWHREMTAGQHAEQFTAWQKHPDNWQQMIQTWEAAIDDPDELELYIQTIGPHLIDQLTFR